MSAKTRTPKSKATQKAAIPYPKGYCGQALSPEYIFVSPSAGEAILAKNADKAYHLKSFANEVALGISQRAKDYLKAYQTGQRFLWTFEDDTVALFSLVVSFPSGLQTIMCVGIKDEFCNENGELAYHAESHTRWGIEERLGTLARPTEIIAGSQPIEQQDTTAGVAL